MTTRKWWIPTLAAATALCCVGGQHNAALAQSDACSNPHCYAVRSMESEDSSFGGARGIMEAAYQQYIDSGSVGHAVWLIVNNAPLQWVEMGVTQSEQGDIAPQPRIYTYVGGYGLEQIDEWRPWGLHNWAEPAQSFKIWLDNVNHRWVFYVDGEIVRWETNANFTPARYYVVGDEIGGSSNNVSGIHAYLDLRWDIYAGVPNCGSLGTPPCNGWWVPTDTRSHLLHGPPPSPREYISAYLANGKQQNYSQCHISEDCPQ